MIGPALSPKNRADRPWRLGSLFSGPGSAILRVAASRANAFPSHRDSSVHCETIQNLQRERSGQTAPRGEKYRPFARGTVRVRSLTGVGVGVTLLVDDSQD